MSRRALMHVLTAQGSVSTAAALRLQIDTEQLSFQVTQPADLLLLKLAHRTKTHTHSLIHMFSMASCRSIAFLNHICTKKSLACARADTSAHSESFFSTLSSIGYHVKPAITFTAEVLYRCIHLSDETGCKSWD